jgi:hypothetical protein
VAVAGGEGGSESWSWSSSIAMVTGARVSRGQSERGAAETQAELWRTAVAGPGGPRLGPGENGCRRLGLPPGENCWRREELVSLPCRSKDWFCVRAS